MRRTLFPGNGTILCACVLVLLVVGVALLSGCSSKSAAKVKLRFLASTGVGGANPFTLVELVLSPVSERLIGGSAFNVGLDFHPDGSLYGASTELRRASPLTGTVTVLGTIRDGSDRVLLVNSIAFAPNGTLYAVVDQKLYTINLATVRATLVGEFPADVFVWGIDFSADGKLYGGEFKLYELNKTTCQVVRTVTESCNVVDIDYAADGNIYGVFYGTSELTRFSPDGGDGELLGTFSSSLWGLTTYNDTRERRNVDATPTTAPSRIAADSENITQALQARRMKDEVAYRASVMAPFPR